MFSHTQESINRFLVHLLYERRTNVSLYNRLKPKRVRVDSYIIGVSEVRYISSWLFPVAFPFRPVNKLSAVIYLKDESFTISHCTKNCGSHGKCMHFVNNERLEYCSCEEGWEGERCQSKLPADLCPSTACAPRARCVVVHRERKLIQCICPLGRSGDRCFIDYHSCVGVVCENNGTCLPLNQQYSDFTCVCPDGFEGSNCEKRRKALNIFIDTTLSDSARIPAAIVIFASPEKSILAQARRLLRDISLPSTVKVYGHAKFTLIQLFYNSSNRSYYMIATQDRPYDLLNTSVVESNRCKHVRHLFNATILNEYSYLRRVKLYHQPCRNDHRLTCFFDEYRMCLCTRDHLSNCFNFDHDLNSCNYCQNQGVCVQENALKNQWRFVCLCERCTFGSLCQFSTADYYVTLDILIGTHIKTGIQSLTEQPTIILVNLIILLLVVASSSLSNLISFLILSSKEIRQVGCDFYLWCLVIIGEVGIVSLFLRFLYMLIIQTYAIEKFIPMKIGCFVLEYCIRLIPSVFDWLIACVSIERAYVVIKDVRFTAATGQKALQLSRWVTLSIVLLNILTTLHRLFFFTLIGEPVVRGGHMRHPWCILQFNSRSWSIYEQFTNIFHLVVPFTLNLASTIFFLWVRTKLELKSTVKRTTGSFSFVLKEQMFKYKSMLISIGIILALELPRLVSTFAYGCIKTEWNRFVYLGIHYMSYLPMACIFVIYILPSPKYKSHLWKMLRKRGLMNRSLRKKS